jgi:hypothetical protein
MLTLGLPTPDADAKMRDSLAQVLTERFSDIVRRASAV